jgi:hypothetical protein
LVIKVNIISYHRWSSHTYLWRTVSPIYIHHTVWLAVNESILWMHQFWIVEIDLVLLHMRLLSQVFSHIWMLNAFCLWKSLGSRLWVVNHSLVNEDIVTVALCPTMLMNLILLYMKTDSTLTLILLEIVIKSYVVTIPLFLLELRILWKPILLIRVFLLHLPWIEWYILVHGMKCLRMLMRHLNLCIRMHPYKILMYLFLIS